MKLYEGTAKALFVKYALPQMIGLLFNSVYMIVDGLFIGHHLGTEAMAAAAVSVPLIEILLALSMAIASGSGVLISGYLGRGERSRSVEIFNTALFCAVVIGATTAVSGNFFLDPLAELMGSTPAIHDKAVEYMRYIIVFSPFLILSFLFSGLARNDGRPKLAMAALAVGSISNIVLDYVFIYPFDMGIGGAALATALGPIFSVLILLPHFLMKKGVLCFARPRLSYRNVERIFLLGFPSFVMEFSIGIITFVYNFAIIHHHYGALGLAAYLVIGYLMLIILTLFLGMAEGLQPVFSYFTGTGEQERCAALRRFAAKVFLASGIACYLLILLFSREFFSIFNPDDSMLINFTENKSLRYFCGFFLAGYNILMISFWQSTGKTEKALAVSLSRSILWPPLLITVLPLFFGREAIWFCHSASEALTAAMVCILLRRFSAPKETFAEAL